MRTDRLYIGTSGYSYKHWADGVFYPSKLNQRDWLEFYSTCFNSVELNVTFYRLPKKTVFERWVEQTPDQFAFSVKGSRFITHLKKLSDCEEALRLFFDHASALKNNLKTVLWQLPPTLKIDAERLEDFCLMLEKTPLSGPVRHAFEFRHQSWFCPEVYKILHCHHHALCIAHSDRWPFAEEITARFVYVRFHGGGLSYGSDYSMKELVRWAGKIKTWLRDGFDVFCYFNNDAYGYAVKNALDLLELVERKV